jgi:hypothetical protein
MNVTKYIESLESQSSPVADLQRPAMSPDELCGAESQSAHGGVASANEDIFEAVGSDSLFGLVEMILKNPARLHKIIRDPARQPQLIPRLLAISLTAFVFFGAAMAVVLTSTHSWPQLTAIADVLDDPSGHLISFRRIEIAGTSAAVVLLRNSFQLTAAYALGLIAATGICLPSLYFHGLLSGVKMTVSDVVIHALKSKATAAVALVGILPIYAAVSMGMVIFHADQTLLNATLWLGLMLPFVAGLWGTYSLYTGFAGICDTLPPERQERRECFLRRLVVAWSAVYTAVSPVMIFSLWAWLQS